MGRKHTTRHKARRKLESCAHQCDIINGYLAEIHAWYEEREEEIGLSLIEIGRVVEAARSLLLELRKSI